MKVVLFSSRHPGNVSKLNVARLVAAYPGYEFTYVLVDNRWKHIKAVIRNRIRETLLLLLLKNPGWYSARRKGEKKIAKQFNHRADAHIKKIVVQDVNGAHTEKTIRDLQPDLILQCGAGILKENIFSIARLGTLNVHHGIAPELRGVSSTFWSMYYGFPEYIGTTVHFVDKTLDTGAVILQKRTTLPEKYDYVEAVVQTSLQGAELLPEAIKTITGPYTVTEEEVKSYYFSSVAYTQYRELEKNNFQPAGNRSTLKYKMKTKKMLQPVTR